MLEFHKIVNTAYWIILGIILLTIATRFLYFKKTQARRTNIRGEKLFFRAIRYLSLLTLPIFIIGLVKFIFVLQKGNLFASQWMKVSLIILLAMLVVSETYYNIRIHSTRWTRILNLFFCVLTLALGFYLNRIYYFAKQHPSIEQSVIIELPFEGNWIASGAGASALTNHHDRIASQKYALDISRLDEDGKLFTGQGIANEESNTYGAEVYSPVDGRIVYLVDSLPDTPTRERDQLAGNHVVIHFQDSLFAALAHLQPHSIPFKVGDLVTTKDVIGKVGMSGNTDFCHLHLHIQDRPKYDIENGRSYPFRFKNFQRKRYLMWREQENAFLLSNDIVRK